jgi:UDP-N-acetylglucosamine--N-acetylmuramyl-(pentapeptide) pyrophosphoryl-undecaprenol N-acetylglucosamine transferase
MSSSGRQLNVAIACGGTGGHLFPGLAVANQLVAHGAQVTLMISAKEVDQLAVKTAPQMRVVTLPAVGLTRGRLLRFLKGFGQSYAFALREFASHPPEAVLAMGGFTSAPPILAGKRLHTCTFLHESNTIPGRANRWLSWVVDRAFVGFPSASQRLRCRHISTTGTPVRPNFRPLEPGPCRAALGLDPARPVVLVMGGSQGAQGINELILRSLALFARRAPDWQWLHLAGNAAVQTLKNSYATAGLAAKVYPFLAETDLAMGAAAAAVSRAGASSLAELAAMRLPAVLVPFPAATDNHQFFNARAFEHSGAAKLLDQASARPEDLADALLDLMCNEVSRQKMQSALAAWHKPQAAEQIAQAIIQAITSHAAGRSSSQPSLSLEPQQKSDSDPERSPKGTNLICQSPRNVRHRAAAA